MDELDIPIFAKAYDLYKLLFGWRNGIEKAARHTLWQKSEQTCLSVIESLLLAGQRCTEQKAPALERASVQLNLLRILLRLARDTRVVDLKKYVVAQQSIDEIGRMLGGWIKSTASKSGAPPPSGIFEMKEKRRKCRTESEPSLSSASGFQLLKLSRSPFQFTLTQLPLAV